MNIRLSRDKDLVACWLWNLPSFQAPKIWAVCTGTVQVRDKIRKERRDWFSSKQSDPTSKHPPSPPTVTWGWESINWYRLPITRANRCQGRYSGRNFRNLSTCCTGWNYRVIEQCRRHAWTLCSQNFFNQSICWLEAVVKVSVYWVLTFEDNGL